MLEFRQRDGAISQGKVFVREKVLLYKIFGKHFLLNIKMSNIGY